MPQWDFLDFLATHARRRSTFRLLMAAEASDLIRRRGRIAGVVARTPSGEIRIEAPLTVGADGRHSVVRERAGLKVASLGAPMDVLWLRLSKQPGDPTELLFRVAAGRIFIQIDRGDYWQCAFAIAKGTYETVHESGLETLRRELVELAPHFAGRVSELKTWDDVKLLTVRVDRLKRWHRPGLLCIGDAAHAMSPVGGVGINLAIQDAVAAANLLHAPLRRGRLADGDLARVQRRREPPTRKTQAMQLRVQNQVIAPVLGAAKKLSPPFALRLLNMFPPLRRIPARMVGIGFLPEHVQTPDVPETLKTRP